MDDFEYWGEDLAKDSPDFDERESTKDDLVDFDVEKLTKDDLLEAIRPEYNAANATSEGHPDRAVHLYALGHHLYQLSLDRGSTSDLDEAIRIGQAAIDSTPESHPDRARYLANLVLKAMIRKQPGFDRFQLPLTDPELRGLARYGPIAIFNVTHIGSDALLITENDIQVLLLPQLTL